MSRFLVSRIARLEAKRKANEPPPRLIGYSLDGTPMWNVEEGADGVLRFVPRYTNEEFAERCRDQQADLMNRLAAYEAELDQADEAPVVGILNDTQAPGTKRPNFIFRNEGGKEVQIDTRTGERTVV